MVEPLPPCVYRDFSDEAYSYNPTTGEQKQIEMWLCTWPTQMGPLPPRIGKMIGGGVAISPEIDCHNCPCRRE